jgi:hypothetical protein
MGKYINNCSLSYLFSLQRLAASRASGVADQASDARNHNHGNQ